MIMALLENEKPIKQKKEHPYSSKFQVKRCSKCDMAWERIKTFDYRSKIWSHITNFPKYGLGLEVCPDCSKDSK
tara:strand:+ start:484 stop:705 length:222 start_codon:yes stop_codon:yes gene_type:complete